MKRIYAIALLALLNYSDAMAQDHINRCATTLPSFKIEDGKLVDNAKDPVFFTGVSTSNGYCIYQNTKYFIYVNRAKGDILIREKFF